MTRPGRFFITLMTVLLVAGLAGHVPVTGQTSGITGEIKESEAELERLRKAAEEKRRQARKLQGEEKSILSKLRKTSEAASATQGYIRKLDARKIRIQNQIHFKERSLEEATHELNLGRQRLVSWMRRAYKHGRTRGMEVVFSSASFSDLLKRTYYLSMVMQQERQLLESVRETRQKVEAEKRDLEKHRSEVAAVKRKKEQESRRYQGLRERHKTEVAKVRGQRKSYEQAARELDAAATRLKKLLSQLEEQRQRQLREGRDAFAIELDRNNFGANRGRLPWPASGTIIGRFGLETHPEWGTKVRNNGIDIRAIEGSAVKSVGDGRVEIADWLAGYGECVILNHGQGYYSIYAHLGSIQVQPGDRVEPGQTVGTVGDSGSLKGVHLHFELRRGRQSEDPSRWLR